MQTGDHWPSVSELMAEFISDFDRFVYPQPIVARAIQAEQTDLNTWRSRGFIDIGCNVNKQVTYSGRGLIHAGIVNELAHIFTPKRAAYFSEELMGVVDGFRDGRMSGMDISFHKNFEDGREMFMAFQLSDDHEPDGSNRTVLRFPLGVLWKEWAQNARLIVRC